MEEEGTYKVPILSLSLVRLLSRLLRSQIIFHCDVNTKIAIMHGVDTTGSWEGTWMVGKFWGSIPWTLLLLVL